MEWKYSGLPCSIVKTNAPLLDLNYQRSWKYPYWICIYPAALVTYRCSHIGNESIFLSICPPSTQSSQSSQEESISSCEVIFKSAPSRRIASQVLARIWSWVAADEFPIFGEEVTYMINHRKNNPKRSTQPRISSGNDAGTVLETDS